MTATAEPAGPPGARVIARQVMADLKPYEGRWAATWRIAAICALVALVFMNYRIPEAAIACYLVFFVFKPESTESSLMAIGVVILVSIVVALMLGVARFTLESPPLQFVVIILASTLFMFLGLASQLGPVGGIIALVIAFIITLFGDVPVGELLTRGMLYAWLMASTPMAIIVLFNATLGLSPVKRMRTDLAERLEASADLLELSGEVDSLGGITTTSDETAARLRLRELLGAGNAEVEKRGGLLRLFHARSRRELDALDRAVSASYQTLLAVAAWHEAPTTVEAAAPYAARLRRHAATLRAGGLPQPMAISSEASSPALPDDRSDALAMLERSLQRLEGDASVHAGDAAPKSPFFAPDAWSNPEYVRYALKTTLAAVICYVIYTGIDWQDIHTAMITCYIVALGSTGETVHKLTLRIIGCLIGATLGIGAVHLLIVPYMTGVGELMLLVFAGCLLAAWVANGPERIAYAGVQIGLAFLMTVLQGFGPDPKVAIAVDRVAGIILGNVVTFIVFTQIWPVSVSQTIRHRLRDAGDQLRRLASLPSWADRGRIGTAAELQQNMALARDTLPLAIFDPHGLRPTPEQWRELRTAIADATALSATLAARGMADPTPVDGPPALSPALQAQLARWTEPTPPNAHGQP